MTRSRIATGAALGWVALLVAACGQGAAVPSGSGASVHALGPRSGSAARSYSPAGTAGVAAPGGVAVPSNKQSAPPPGVGEGPRVIRTARLTLEVGAGHFDSSLDRVMSLVSEEGGYIAGSDAGSASGPIRHGVITFEVPAARFQDSIARLRKMGRLQDLNIQGQDVSAQYVDLQARLQNEEAQRDAMLALLKQATSIGDIISIQNQLGAITQQIEEYKGQIGLLDHQTSYSTITATIEESPLVPGRPPGDSWGFVTALGQSLHYFVRTVNGILVGLGAAGPALLILIGLGLAYWRWGARRRAQQGGAGA
ncbi:MAG: DUF4349 domain-containing protein [Candidatus Dormibacteraceae bacterium]